ncbi:hypothetical protein HLV40_06475 [Chromohalobacter salexigens]|nr:hypothetical protein [Chromohalobacter salexigens]
MKLCKILSSELPEIDNLVKECVNSGQWMLFKSRSFSRSSQVSVFYLKAGEDILELDERGGVVSELRSPRVDIELDEIVYFSDLPQPDSLSNLALSYT